MIKIKLKDGNILEAESGTTVAEVAAQISEGLMRMALVAKVNDDLVDLSHKLVKDCTLSILTYKDEEAKEVYRHTASHILAQAVKNIYPTVRLGVGPATENGFYYDFDFVSPIKQEDLAKIEAEMEKIIAQDWPIIRMQKSRAEAVKVLDAANQLYKLDILKDIPKGDKISFYKQDGFTDLCVGPHLPSTGKIKAFKLTKITGAYWKGDQKNQMLTRIYGVAFDKKAELVEYLELQEQIKQRDHNKIGRELGIFTTDEAVGQGLPLLMPKGAKMIQILQRFVEDEEERRGYLFTKTPVMAKSDLYKISGHWQHYKDGMFIMGDEVIDENNVMALRPMTCPFQFCIYKNGLKSYRDLPVRYAETATLMRNESSGEMHGLVRLRQFTLSDGHIVCTPEQIEQVFNECIDLINYFLKVLHIEKDVSIRLSKWSEANKEKYINNPKAWVSSQNIIRDILKKNKMKFTEADGEAAFYGPKIDFQMKNVYGKEDTIITVQLDFALAERFDMTYIDEKGKAARPFIVHRSSMGCYERTLAMLIEKYMGAFPLWLSPTQVSVLTISEKFNDYAAEVNKKLVLAGFRSVTDTRAEKIGYKIRACQLDKLPYMVIVGEKETNEKTISVRKRDGGQDLGTMSIENFIEILKKDLTEFN